jgi:hypothetical protein
MPNSWLMKTIQFDKYQCCNLDYLKQSSNNYGKSGKVVDAGKTYQNGLEKKQSRL